MQVQNSSGLDSSNLNEEAKSQAAAVDELLKQAIDSANGFFIQWFWLLLQLLLQLVLSRVRASKIPGTAPVHQARSFKFNAIMPEGLDDGDLIATWHLIKCICQVKFKTSEKFLNHPKEDLMKSILYHIDLENAKQGCSNLLYVYVSLFLDASNLVQQWRQQQATGQFNAEDDVVQQLRAKIEAAIEEDYQKHISASTQQQPLEQQQQQAEQQQPPEQQQQQAEQQQPPEQQQQQAKQQQQPPEQQQQQHQWGQKGQLNLARTNSYQGTCTAGAKTQTTSCGRSQGPSEVDSGSITGGTAATAIAICAEAAGNTNANGRPKDSSRTEGSSGMQG